jgi:hypothetical protein
MRHGLTGHTIVLPAEDLVAYQDFTNQFVADFKPVGILEKQLVQSLADTSWRLNRIAALESNLMALGFSEHENRLKIEHPEAHAAMVIMEALREETRALAVLSLHTARLSRRFEKTKQQLHESAAPPKPVSSKKPPLSSRWTRNKDFPTSHPKMASFFQTPRSRPSSVAETASKQRQPPHEPCRVAWMIVNLPALH